MNKGRLGIIGAIIIFLFAGGIIFYYVKTKPVYVAKIDNYGITLAEYYVYLYGQKNEFESRGGSDIWETDFYGETPDNVAKQRTINSIALIKFSCDHAKKLGIELTNEEKQEAARIAEETYQSFPQDFKDKTGITIIDIKKIMEENELFNNVFEKTTEDFELSHTDFETFYSLYTLQNRKDNGKMYLNHILIQSPGDDDIDDIDVAENILELAQNTEDFDSLVRTYSDDYTEEDEIVYFEATEQNFPPQVLEAAYVLSEGEISPVIPTEEGYYIIKAEQVTEPEETYTKEQLKDLFTTQKKREFYEQEYAKWAEGAKTILYEKRLDQILASEL